MQTCNLSSKVTIPKLFSGSKEDKREERRCSLLTASFVVESTPTFLFKGSSIAIQSLINNPIITTIIIKVKKTCNLKYQEGQRC